MIDAIVIPIALPVLRDALPGVASAKSREMYYFENK
jgi:hypothetical protein